MTVLTLATGATGTAQVTVPTATWHTLDTETLDAVVRAGVDVTRPSVRRR